MTGRSIVRTLGGINPEFIIASAPDIKPRRHNTVRWLAAAACFAVLLSLIPAILLLNGRTPAVTDSSDPAVSETVSESGVSKLGDVSIDPRAYDTFDYDNITGESLATVTYSQTLGGSTGAYDILYVMDESELLTDNIPTNGEIGLYYYNGAGLPLDTDSFEKMVAETESRISAFIGKKPDDERKEYNFEDKILVASLRIDHKYGEISCDYSQDNLYEWVGLHLPESKETGLGNFDGLNLTIDQRDSDDEILCVINEAKDKLFKLFGVSFSKVSIERHYSGHSYVDSIDIRFYDDVYDRIDIKGNRKYQSELRLSYYNSSEGRTEGWTDTFIYSEGELDISYISYKRYREPINEVYVRVRQARLLEMTEVDDYINNDYFYGGHMCPLCAAEQEEICFIDYDAIGIVYFKKSVMRKDEAKELLPVLPFYALYKYLYTAENGLKVYACAYVPAIEASGLDEYFNSQMDKHENIPSATVDKNLYLKDEKITVTIEIPEGVEVYCGTDACTLVNDYGQSMTNAYKVGEGATRVEGESLRTGSFVLTFDTSGSVDYTESTYRIEVRLKINGVDRRIYSNEFYLAGDKPVCDEMRSTMYFNSIGHLRDFIDKVKNSDDEYFMCKGYTADETRTDTNAFVATRKAAEEYADSIIANLRNRLGLNYTDEIYPCLGKNWDYTGKVWVTTIGQCLIMGYDIEGIRFKFTYFADLSNREDYPFSQKVFDAEPVLKDVRMGDTYMSLYNKGLDYYGSFLYNGERVYMEIYCYSSGDRDYITAIKSIISKFRFTAIE